MERDDPRRGSGVNVEISTHTLTWSVTSSSVAVLDLIAYFNSHAHVERDRRPKSGVTPLQNFNSHAHVERDLPALTAYVAYDNFNSHAHVERDA